MVWVRSSPGGGAAAGSRPALVVPVPAWGGAPPPAGGAWAPSELAGRRMGVGVGVAWPLTSSSSPAPSWTLAHTRRRRREPRARSNDSQAATRGCARYAPHMHTHAGRGMAPGPLSCGRCADPAVLTRAGTPRPHTVVAVLVHNHAHISLTTSPVRSKLLR